jgi:flagellar motor protein MotB
LAFCPNRRKPRQPRESICHEKPPPQIAAEVNHERWLVSYADFVTLLFAFFVVLYASAQIDKQRASRLSDAINSAFQQLGIFERDGHKPGEIDPKISLPSAVNGAQDLSRWAPAGQEKLGADQKKANFNAIRSELEKALAAEIARNEVALHMEADGLGGQSARGRFLRQRFGHHQARRRSRLCARRKHSARALLRRQN